MTSFLTIDDVDLIDMGKIAALLPAAWSSKRAATRLQYIGAMINSFSVLSKYKINSPLRVAHFIGQTLIESGYLTATVESLKYSDWKRIRSVFGSRVASDEIAKSLVKNEKKLAEHVYGHQTQKGQSLGNTAPGDGWKYRGRGLIQITGKNNYQQIGNEMGVDLVKDPDLLVRDLGRAIESAAAYWSIHNLNTYADHQDWKAGAKMLSRAINLGSPNRSRAAEHEKDRISWTKRVLDALNNPELVYEDTGEIQLGSRGDRVSKLQEALKTLGFLSGRIDGDFGPQTHRAVVAFQEENDLQINGVVNDETWGVIQEKLEDVRRPLPTERENATARDLKKNGDREVAISEGVRTGGGIVAGAGAAGVAADNSEVVADVVGSITGSTIDDSQQEAESSQDTRDQSTAEDERSTDPVTSEEPQITETVEQPSEPATEEKTEITDYSWIFWLIVILIGLYVFFRAGRLIKNRVREYRRGEI